MTDKVVKDFWVIGVGASAGGLEALTSFLRSLPENPNAAFVIAQHLSPHAKSMMVELLSRQTPLPVIAVSENLELKAGQISVIPPNFDATIENGFIKLAQAEEAPRPKPSVDLLFESIAQNYGRTAVGIVLSGTGSDGSEGIRVIKKYGGVTLVQDSGSAKYDGMPKSAFETGLVDAILPPSDLAARLFEILEQHRTRGPIIPHDEEHVNFGEILRYLKKEGAADFTQYKISTVQRRIEKRLAHLGMGSLAAYFAYLKSKPSEVNALAQEMLISVTSFFRDPEAYEALSHQLETVLAQRKTNDDFRVWVAGCATGEEAYSFAFMISDILERQPRTLPIKIFASDLDDEAISQARSGLYSALEVADLSPATLEKFFEKRERLFEVKKCIRDRVVFARQDLVQNPPFVKMDLVSCRNVLIYFEPPLQNKIFDMFHYALKPDGYLFLGKSENAPAFLFETIDKKSKIFKRQNVLTRTFSPTIANPYSMTPSEGSVGSARRKHGPAPVPQEVAALHVLRACGISGVIVDEDGAVLHLVGDVSRFLGVPAGQADFRLNNLLPKNAGVELSVLTRKARKDAKLHRSRVHRLDADPKRSFTFAVKSLEDTSISSKPLFVVYFEAKKVSRMKDLVPHVSADSLVGDLPARVIELEQEVLASREHLQTVIEELETTNEELQSLNEELSSTNEELQASNEELETTNEELQASNEELTTLNEELNVRSAELRFANASLENIQASIGAPLLVVDSELRLVKFNQNADEVFTLSTADIGAPVTQASCHCEIPDFEASIVETISTGVVSEGLCHSHRRIFQMRVHPCRDENKRIVGAVIFFFDNTQLIQTQEKLRASDGRIRSIIDGSPTLICLKDALGRYLTVNKSFLDRYGLVENAVIGKTDREIFPDKTANQFRDFDLEVLLRRVPTEHHERVEIGGTSSVMLSHRFPLYLGSDQNPYAVGTVSLDITAQTTAQERLHQSESRYKAIVEDQAVFVCRHLVDGTLTFSNSAFSKYFGGHIDGSVNRRFISIVDKADQKKVQADLEALSPDHPIVQYEHRVAGFGLEPQRWVRWIHKGIFDASGAPVEFQAVGFDVTELHHRTADLIDKENLFTHVLEYTSDYLSVYKVEGPRFFLESFNQSVAKNRGFSQSQLIGKSLSELIDPSRVDLIVDRYQNCVATGSTTNFEEEIEAPGGKRILSTTLVPIPNVHGVIDRVAALSRDITKLKRVEEVIRDEKKKADTANRAKSDFLAAMSHELRTPLNVISGMTQLLARSQLKPEHERLVASIHRSSKVLLSLIEDILDLSKIEAGKVMLELKPFDLEHLAAEIMQSFETLASQKGIELKSVFEIGPTSRFLGDQIRLKQILTNLIGNAIKFTERGAVTLKITRARSDSPGFHSLRFDVIDTGVGIPEEAFGRLFQRFSQADSGTSRKYGGSGLGLIICKELVELMNGNIGFESEPGRGSVFTFNVQLPEAAGAELHLDSESASVVGSDAAAKISDMTVLAVDDNVESLSVVRSFLTEQGVNLITVESGQEALAVLEKNLVDVVLMDMQMPGLDGLETTRKIRKLPPPRNRVPVIAFTANAMLGDADLCLQAGMNDYLTKPIDFGVLTKRIARWGHNSDSGGRGASHDR